MGKRDEIEVNCYCRIPSLKDMEMVECSVCFQKVHSLCDDLATSYSYRQARPQYALHMPSYCS